MAANKFPGKCSKCSELVPAGEGTLARENGQWLVTHSDCATTAPTPAPVPFVPRQTRLVLPDVDTVELDGVDTAALFRHQAQVVAAVKAGARALLLADEPGLGKTATALLSLVAAGSHRALVVVPAVVKINWAREVERWTPGRRVQVLSGRTPSPIDPSAEVLIINYDIIAFWVPALIAARVDALIVDEAHYVKDSKATRTKAVEEIAGTLPFSSLRMLLTGTPIPNRPVELVTPLKVLRQLRAVGGGFWPFVTRYCGAREDTWGWDLTGATHLDELNEKLTRTCMVRRRKADALDLPTRTVVDVPVELTGASARTVAKAQRVLVDRLVGLVVDKVYGDKTPAPAGPVIASEKLVRRVVSVGIAGGGAAFSELAALRAALGEAKAPLVVEHARGLVAGSDAPVVVFAHHRAVQDALATQLDDLGVVRVTGGQDADDRQHQIDAFQAGSARVAVCSTQAAGVGVTLHAASQVVLGELPGTAAAQAQAIDRVHRIGQTEPVTAWRIVAAGTLDEHMAATIARKAALALEAVDGGTADPLSEEIDAVDALLPLVMNALATRKTSSRRKTETTEVGAEPAAA